jgi:hypothetical protein
LVPLQQFHTFWGFWHVKNQMKFLQAYRAVIFQQILSLYGEKFAKFLKTQNWKKKKTGEKKLGSSASPSPRTHICQLMICTL